MEQKRWAVHWSQDEQHKHAIPVVFDVDVHSTRKELMMALCKEMDLHLFCAFQVKVSHNDGSDYMLESSLPRMGSNHRFPHHRLIRTIFSAQVAPTQNKLHLRTGTGSSLMNYQTSSLTHAPSLKTWAAVQHRIEMVAFSQEFHLIHHTLLWSTGCYWTQGILSAVMVTYLTRVGSYWPTARCVSTQWKWTPTSKNGGQGSRHSALGDYYHSIRDRFTLLPDMPQPLMQMNPKSPECSCQRILTQRTNSSAVWQRNIERNGPLL